MNLTETLSLLSLLFFIILAVGGVVIKIQRNDEKHSNKEEAMMAIIKANKLQEDKDITAIDKKADTVMTEFRAFVNKHFETEASNNKEIMQKLEQNNRDIMGKFDEVNKKFDEVGKKFDDVNKEITQIKVDMSSISLSSGKRVALYKTVNDR